MPENHPDTSKKALIIGLDGVACSLLKDMMADGVMPNFKKILQKGFALHAMDVSIPEVSSVSWTSFSTGVNPAEHGIYGFMDLKPSSYDLYFPNSQSVRAPAFWDILGRTQGAKRSTLLDRFQNKVTRRHACTVLNMPQTYPAYPLNGVMVSGFVSLDLKKAVYPAGAVGYLEGINYELDLDVEPIKEDRALFFRQLASVYEKRENAFRHFYAQYPRDMFFCVVTETDRLHHYHYDIVADKNSPFRREVAAFYARVDSFVHEMFDAFMNETDGKGLFMMMSDHGFTPIEKEVYMNAVLQENGFLKLGAEGKLFHRIEPESRAFSLDPARIYIHAEGRYPKGSVKKEDKESVMADVEQMLLGLRDESGKAVIKQVVRGDELYKGPCRAMGPDLVCVPHYGYDLKSSINKTSAFGRSLLTGMHTQDDAFCVLPDTVSAGGKFHIENLAPVIVRYYVEEEI